MATELEDLELYGNKGDGRYTPGMKLDDIKKELATHPDFFNEENRLQYFIPIRIFVERIATLHIENFYLSEDLKVKNMVLRQLALSRDSPKVAGVIQTVLSREFAIAQAYMCQLQEER